MAKREYIDQSIYQKHGFANRKEYLDSLAEEYGEIVYILASVLGPTEDFDALITECEDYSL